MNEDIISNLKEALSVSPGNIPLRLQLAGMLLNANKKEEAEKHFIYVLGKQPENEKAKLGLAKLYFKQEDFSTATVILEDIADTTTNTEVLLLYTKLLIKENALSEAKKYYRKALDIIPNLQDEELDHIFRVASGNTKDEEDFLSELEESMENFAEKPTISFKDVGGLADVKEEINIKIIQPLKHADLYKAYGKKTGGGILLYGPPGCGKTHLARATAGEINAQFFVVGINDILEMWIGESEKSLHKAFETARYNAPCVLFFDEVDALGASRSDMKQSAGRHLINQFLSEMDGVNDSNDGVLILAATNAPWHLDAAFRRPGRFDRIIFVKPPDMEARKAILPILLKGKPLQEINYKEVAKASADFSGADLQAVVDVAVEEKLRESFKTGIPEPIGTKDLLVAIKKVKPSTKEWFTSARNYALYANESGLYDDILDYLKIKK